MTDWLLSTLLWTSALMAGVMALREPVRRRFGPAAAYGLWCVPALRAILPPIERTIERSVDVAPALSPSLSSDAALVPLATVAPPSAIVEPSLLETLGGWPTLLLAAWAMGAVLLFGWRMRDYRRQRGAILASGTRLAAIEGIRLVRSPLVRGPVAFGLFDRVIAVPCDFDRRFEPAERRLALEHELAHHRSGDLFANLAAFVLLCLQWFNPLAWVAHAAFRFDQEAACDARVLDKAPAGDRLSYGTAIAKAASGRALLFASALDNRSSLHRRLSTMTIRPTRRQRLVGSAAILLALGVALPLSATYAIRYVDVPTAPKAPRAPLAPAAPAAPAAPVAALADAARVPAPPAAPAIPAAPRVPDIDLGPIGEDTVRIDGRTLRWDELTAEQRSKIRKETSKARAQLSGERRNISRELAAARAEVARIDNGEMERELAEARRDVEEGIREIDANAADLRRHGVNPEKIKQQMRQALAEVGKIDTDKIRREAMAGIDEKAIERSIAEAEASLDRITARLDALDRAD